MPIPPLEPTLEIRVHPDHTALRITGCDRLDEYNSPAVSRQLSDLPERSAGERLVLDLDGIHFVTSLALGGFVSLSRRVRSAGGKLVLANVSSFVQETLAITRLDQLMDVEPADDAPSAGRLSA